MNQLIFSETNLQFPSDVLYNRQLSASVLALSCPAYLFSNSAPGPLLEFVWSVIRKDSFLNKPKPSSYVPKPGEAIEFDDLVKLCVNTKLLIDHQEHTWLGNLPRIEEVLERVNQYVLLSINNNRSDIVKFLNISFSIATVSPNQVPTDVQIEQQSLLMKLNSAIPAVIRIINDRIVVLHPIFKYLSEKPKHKLIIPGQEDTNDLTQSEVIPGFMYNLLTGEKTEITTDSMPLPKTEWCIKKESVYYVVPLTVGSLLDLIFLYILQSSIAINQMGPHMILPNAFDVPPAGQLIDPSQISVGGPDNSTSDSSNVSSSPKHYSMFVDPITIQSNDLIG